MLCHAVQTQQKYAIDAMELAYVKHVTETVFLQLVTTLQGNGKTHSVIFVGLVENVQSVEVLDGLMINNTH